MTVALCAYVFKMYVQYGNFLVCRLFQIICDNDYHFYNTSHIYNTSSTLHSSTPNFRRCGCFKKKKNTFSEFIFVCVRISTLYNNNSHTTIPLVYPSRVTRHAFLRSLVTCLFFTIHCLLAAWVSLPIIIFHFLSLITLLSVVHVSIMSRGNENFFPEKNDFFLKERNSSFSFNLLVPKLINNLR